MKRVTRNIDPACARDLLERAPRACMSFACDDGPHAQPIAMVWHDGRHLAGVPTDAGRGPVSGQEVTVLIGRRLPLIRNNRAQGAEKGRTCVIDVTPEQAEILLDADRH